MRDYAGCPHMHKRARARRKDWRAMSRAKGNTALFWKTLSIIALLAAVVGVAASYWVGHRIQESLTGIAHAQELRSNKAQVKAELLNEQERLLQFQHLEALAAVQVGLYSPAKRQQVGFR